MLGEGGGGEGRFFGSNIFCEDAYSIKSIVFSNFLYFYSMCT